MHVFGALASPKTKYAPPHLEFNGKNRPVDKASLKKRDYHLLTPYGHWRQVSAEDVIGVVVNTHVQLSKDTVVTMVIMLAHFNMHLLKCSAFSCLFLLLLDCSP